MSKLLGGPFMIPVIISFPVHNSIVSHSDRYLEIGNDLLKEGIADGSALPLDRQCVHDEDESLYPSNDLVVAVSINFCSSAVSTDDLFPIHRPQAVVLVGCTTRCTRTGTFDHLLSSTD